MSNSSIWPVDRTLSSATTLSGPGSNGSEILLRITQSSNITVALPSDCLVSYPGHSLGGVLTPLLRCQLVCSTASADRATGDLKRLAVSLQWKNASLNWCEKCTRRKRTNHIKNEYTSWHRSFTSVSMIWLGKVIHWELCKQLRFYNTD